MLAVINPLISPLYAEGGNRGVILPMNRGRYDIKVQLTGVEDAG